MTARASIIRQLPTLKSQLPTLKLPTRPNRHLIFTFARGPSRPSAPAPWSSAGGRSQPPPRATDVRPCAPRSESGSDGRTPLNCCARWNAYFASTDSSSVRTAWSTTSSSRAASNTSPHNSCDVVRSVGERRRAGALDCLPHRVRIEPFAFLQLGEDVVGANGRVLQIRTALPLEAEGLVDVEGDDFAARELDHEVADRRGRDRLPRFARTSSGPNSGLRCATSAAALSVSRSSRSSAFTPRPLRPDTSTNGLPASSLVCVAELARGRVRQRDHLVRVVDRPPSLFREPEHGQRLLEQLLQVRLPRVDDVADHCRVAEPGRAGRSAPASEVVDHSARSPLSRRTVDSGSRARAARTSTAGTPCPCRRR